MRMRCAARLALAGWIFLSGVGMTNLQAQEVPVPRIVIVDTDRILRESSAAQGIVQQIESMNRALQQDIGREEQKLKQEHANLKAQRADMAAEVFQTRIGEIQIRRRSIEETVQKRSQLIGAALKDANDQLQIALQPILTSIIEEKGANLLLEKSRVAFHVPEMDVTEQALIQLNARTPSIAVRMPQPAK